MKNRLKILTGLLLSVWIVTGCEKDNYDAPTSYITGKVVYQGKPLQLRGNDVVTLQLYQHGYAYFNPVNVYVNQNGEFSVCIFDGDYKLITKSGNGPWTSQGRDSIDIHLRGTAIQDVEVIPYYLVDNATITLNGNTVNASFTVNNIAGKGIDRVFVVLGTTHFINDGQHNVDRYDETANLGNYANGGQTYTFAAKDYSGHQMFQTALSRGTLFARIGLWPSGSDQAIYSEVIRLK